MTLILEFRHKLIFYKPGILHYAMRQAARQLNATKNCAQRHELLSHALKCGWAEAKAQLAALQRLQALASGGGGRSHHADIQIAGSSGHSDRLIHDRADVSAIAPQEDASSTALARGQLH